jgi:hypothetical protein
MRPATAEAAEIPALLPSVDGGHQFVVYGDSCSGRPGFKYEQNLAQVNSVVRRIRPAPEFICFVGDHVMGGVADPEELRRQWQYWLNQEMAWLDRKRIPLYSTTSNHNTYSKESELVFREIFADLPQNGPAGQKGLSYFVRRGNLLLVCVNTSYSGIGGHGHVEAEWLDQVLTSQADADFKFVAGHHPALPVNGYVLRPQWCIVEDEASVFWSVLRRHRVLAYLCSHIIAYDVQVRDGVLQVCTGGAGTNAGPGGFMPGPTEYLHALQFALDRQGARWQVLDVDGRTREWLRWPLSVPPAHRWHSIPGDQAKAVLAKATVFQGSDKATQSFAAWRFRGMRKQPSGEATETLLCGWDNGETAPTIWVGFEDGSRRLTVRLLPQSGSGTQVWRSARIDDKAPFNFQLALHGGMGPGGILFRFRDEDPWSSLTTSSSRGAENLRWPSGWHIGYGVNGANDDPFLGSGLQLEWHQEQLRGLRT